MLRRQKESVKMGHAAQEALVFGQLIFLFQYFIDRPMRFEAPNHICYIKPGGQQRACGN